MTWTAKPRRKANGVKEKVAGDHVGFREDVYTKRMQCITSMRFTCVVTWKEPPCPVKGNCSRRHRRL